MLNAVALKLSEFWETSALAEAQFALRDITADATKYYYMVLTLSSATATRVVTFLPNSPVVDKYEMLKAHLLKTFELSDAE